MRNGTTVAVLACVALIAGACSATGSENEKATTSWTGPATAAVSTTAGSSISETTIAPTAIPARPLTILASHMAVDAGPVEWEWVSEYTLDPVFSPALQRGDYCYGHSSPPPPSNRDMAFLDGTLTLSVGRYVSPTVSVEDDNGAAVIDNPFGEDAWVCTVASDGESVLAVGSDVWWSNDAITWHVVDAFRGMGGAFTFEGVETEDSNLVWAAVGPLGYVVLGRSNRDGWFSPDLTTWYPIDPAAGPDPYHTQRGWFGPGNVTISNEAIAIGSGDWSGAWIGKPRT